MTRTKAATGTAMSASVRVALVVALVLTLAFVADHPHAAASPMVTSYDADISSLFPHLAVRRDDVTAPLASPPPLPEFLHRDSTASGASLVIDQTFYVFGAPYPDDPASGLGLMYTAIPGNPAGTWSQFQTPMATVAMSATVVNGTIFFIGGGSNSGEGCPVHCPTAKVWKIPIPKSPPGPNDFIPCNSLMHVGAPDPRVYHGAVAHNTDILVVGGYSDGGPQSTVGAYDTVTEKWNPTAYPTMTYRRYGAAIVKIGTLLIAAGGVTDSEDSYLDSVEVLDLSSSSPAFMLGPPLSSRRGYLAGTSYGCQMYVLGGDTQEGSRALPQSIVEVYNPHGNGSWFLAPNQLPDGWDEFTALSAYAFDAIYAVAGHNKAVNIPIVPCPKQFSGPNCNAESGLTCNAGYLPDPDARGVKCLACPGMPDGLCAGPCFGHGDCYLGPGNQPTCSCHPNFDPVVACETCIASRRGDTCETCALGYFGSTCQRCPEVDGRVCSNRGTCDGSGTNSGTGRCHCDAGFTGLMCEQCDVGYFGDNCLPCPGPDQDCYSHGHCFDGILGNGTCGCFSDFGGNNCETCRSVDKNGNCKECPKGFYGDQCALCPNATLLANGTITSVCSGRGTCLDDVHGSGQCVCDAGYSGEACESCASGFYGDTCAACPGVSHIQNWEGYSGGAAALQCYYHGACSQQDGTCACTSSWTGPSCCEWNDCPSSPLAFAIGMIFLVAVFVVMMTIFGGVATKNALICWIPSLQLMAAAVTYSPVRFLSILAESRPAAFAAVKFNFPHVQDLHVFLTNFAVFLGADLSHYKYLSFCSSPPPLPFLILAPLAALILVALLALIPVLFAVRNNKPRKSAAEVPMLPVDQQTTFTVREARRKATYGQRFLEVMVVASAFLYVSLSLQALESLQCSKRETCDPNRRLVVCSSANRWPMFAAGAALVLFWALGLPAVFGTWTWPSTGLCKSRGKKRKHHRQPSHAMRSMVQDTDGEEGVPGGDADAGEEVVAYSSPPKPATTRSHSTPASPLHFFTSAVKPEGSYWATLLLFRRVVLLIPFALDAPWYVGLAVAAVINLSWVLTREYLQPYTDTYRWQRWADIGFAFAEVAFLAMLAVVGNAVDKMKVARPEIPPAVSSSTSSQVNKAAQAATAVASLTLVGVVFVVLAAMWHDYKKREEWKEAQGDSSDDDIEAPNPAAGVLTKPRSSSTLQPSPQQFQPEPLPAHAIQQQYAPPSVHSSRGEDKRKRRKPKKPKRPVQVDSWSTIQSLEVSELGPSTGGGIGGAPVSARFPPTTMVPGSAVGTTAAAPPAEALAPGGMVSPAAISETSPAPTAASVSPFSPQGGTSTGGSALSPSMPIGSGAVGPVAPGDDYLGLLPSSTALDGGRRRKPRKKKRSRKSGHPAVSDDPFGDLAASPVRQAGEAAELFKALGITDMKTDYHPTRDRTTDSVSGFSSISHGLQFEEEAQCPNCGVQVLANCNFCHNCGKQVVFDGAHAGRVSSD